MLTPFTKKGDIDIVAIRDYLQYLHECGVQRVLVNGTTGEFASLTTAERRIALETVRAHWPRTLIAHVGSASLPQAIELLDHAGEIADVAAAIAPYFFAHAPQTGIRAFFAELLERAHVPFLLYNFPLHTQCPIEPRTVGELAEQFPLLAGVKDSGKDRSISQRYQLARNDFQVFLGDDGAALSALQHGYAGIVTGAGNPVARLPVTIAAKAADDVGLARRLQERFDSWSHTRRATGVPEIAFVKAAMSSHLPGFPLNTRLPLSAADDAVVAVAVRATRECLAD